jgi:hypothetical protein
MKHFYASETDFIIMKFEVMPENALLWPYFWNKTVYRMTDILGK